MPADEFAERLAKVRNRFVSTLAAKIADAQAALPKLAAETLALDTLDETYQRVHGLCGTGPTVGFPETGKAARAAEQILLAPYRAHRGLSPDELAALDQELQNLRQVAGSELAAAAAGGQ